MILALCKIAEAFHKACCTSVIPRSFDVESESDPSPCVRMIPDLGMERSLKLAVVHIISR